MSFYDKFQAEPLPERFVHLVSAIPIKEMQVGITTRTLTDDGLKIVPTKEVTFLIGKADTGKTTAAWDSVFNLPSTMARALSERLAEFADAIESGQ